MNEETEAIIKAIEGLQQEPNILKNILYSIGIPLFSSLLGAAVAYYTVHYQNKIKFEEEKIKAINSWLLMAESAIQSLISIKRNYQDNLDSNPIQRTMIIRSTIHNLRKVDRNVSELSFLVPNRNDSDAIETKWRNVLLINMMFENYNHIIELWNKQNEESRLLRTKILKDYSDLSYADVTQEQIFKSVNQSDFMTLVLLTEFAIKLTDDIIIELNDFISEFPNVGKSMLNLKVVKNYVTIISISHKEDSSYSDLIKRVPEVDYEIISILSKTSVDDVKKELFTGYER